MRQFSYIPKTEIFDGEIVIKILNAVERIDLGLECNFQVKNVQIEFAESAKQAKKLIEIAMNQIVSVNVTRREDGVQFTSIDDLSYDDQGTSLLIEVGSACLNGVRLGKK